MFYFKILFAICAKTIDVIKPKIIVRIVDHPPSEEKIGIAAPITHPPINSLDTSKKYVASFSLLALSF